MLKAAEIAVSPKPVSVPFELLSRLDRRISAAGTFTAGIAILVVYLLGMRYHAHLPASLFFISIALVMGTILYQCLALNPSNGYAGVVLGEICVASVVFHLIYQVPGFGLWGSDSYLDLVSLRTIINTGHIRGIPEYVQLTSFFPVIHVIGAQVSQVTGIDYFSVAKWLPSLVAVTTIPLAYLLMGLVYRNEKALLLAALLFASLQHHMIFGSLFVRETVALVLMMCSVYLYFAARYSEHPVAYRAMALVCLAGTVIAHHLTSLMLIVFLGICWIVPLLLKAVRKWKPEIPAVTNVSFSLLLIAIIGTSVYWITTVTMPLLIIVSFVRNILTPAMWGQYTYLGQASLALPSFRYYVLMYGSYLCYVVFCVFLLFKVFSRSSAGRQETLSFTLFLSLCGLTGVIAFYLLPATIGGDRFLSFGWLFGFAPMTVSVLENSRQWLVKMGIAFMMLFMFLNIFTIHPTIWDAGRPGAGGSAWREDFALAEKMDMKYGLVLANLNNLMPIYALQNKNGIDYFALTAPIDVYEYDWVIVNRKGLWQEGLYSDYTHQALTEIKKLGSANDQDHIRNFESNNLAVFKRR